MPTLAYRKPPSNSAFSALAKTCAAVSSGGFGKLLYTLNNRYEPYAHQSSRPIRVGGHLLGVLLAVREGGPWSRSFPWALVG